MEKPIAFSAGQSTGLEEIAGAGQASINIIVDPQGCVYRRPGIGAYSGATTGVVDSGGLVMIHETVDGDLFAVGTGVPDRPIYQITSGGSIALGGGVAGQGLCGTTRPVIAETETLLLFAGGLLMQKVDKATKTSARLGGTPPQATHVIVTEGRALANDPGSTDLTTDFKSVRFSEPANAWPLGAPVRGGGYEGWDKAGLGTAGYYNCAKKPDPVVALAEVGGDVFNFGTRTLEVGGLELETLSTTALNAGKMIWRTTFSKEIGISAYHSIVKDGDDLYWIDDRRRIVQFSGRTIASVSAPIQRAIDAMSTVSDAYGFRISIGFLDAIAWTFPSDGRTFVYQKGVGWFQWAGWANGNWSAFPITSAIRRTGQGDVVVSLSDGRVGALSLDSSLDWTTPIHARVVSGYEARGTSKEKYCAGVRLVLRRGKATSQSPGPHGWLLFRDRPGDWTGRIPVYLGGSGETEFTLPFYALGNYRARQWGFEFSGTDSFVLVSAIEDFEVLE